jgi:hypothetical protein
MKPRFSSFLLSAVILGGSLAAAHGQPSLSRFPYNGDDQAADPAPAAKAPERLGGQVIHPAAEAGIDPSPPEVHTEQPAEAGSRFPYGSGDTPASGVIKIGQGPAPKAARPAKVAEPAPLDSLSAAPPPVPTSQHLTPAIQNAAAVRPAGFAASQGGDGGPSSSSPAPVSRFPYTNSDDQTPAAWAPKPSAQTVIKIGDKPAPAGHTLDGHGESASREGRSVTVPASEGIAGAGGPSMLMVNSPNLIIHFKVKDLGPSGIGTVDLWYTRNGQSWHRFNVPPQSQSPFQVDVPEDGLYGFTVVANNGMGIGKSPPQPGDPPQMWVDVDTTKPEVHLLNTVAGIDEHGRTLALHWAASDRNLPPRPITLCYAEQPQGPWIPFATNLENSGHYTWQMSPGLPNQVLVKVSATDRVGNIGEDQSSMPSPVDLSKPMARIESVNSNGGVQQAGGQQH